MSPPKSRGGIGSNRDLMQQNRPREEPLDEENDSVGSESEEESDSELRHRQKSPKHGGSGQDTESIYDLSSSMEKANISDRPIDSPRIRTGLSPIRGNIIPESSRNLYPSLDELRENSQCCHNSSGASNRRDVAGNDSQKWLIIFVFVFIIFMLVVSIMYIPMRQETPHEEHSSYVFLEDIEHDLRSIFRNQSPAIWRVIRSQLGLQLRRRKDAPETPRPLVRPAVLLIAGTDRGLTMRCFSRKLGVFVARSFKRIVCVRADAEENQDSGHVAKWQMDQVVRNGYEQGDRCFHVQRLESLSGPELLMLHAWCDGETSPYKDAVFIISLLMKGNATNESEVETHLSQRWTELLGADETPALLSRVANNIVVIEEEENSMSHCLT